MVIDRRYSYCSSPGGLRRIPIPSISTLHISPFFIQSRGLRAKTHARLEFEATPRDSALRSEDGWVEMDVRWLFTRDTVGSEHSVFGITVFPPGSKHDIHRHPNAEEFEYLVSGRGIARVGDADVELGPGEVVFVPTNDYHGFENTGDEPVFMIWGYAGAASLDEAGYIRYVDDHPA